ncbi:MAG: response regulator [Pyrinomonadaceae bacterium]|nr:response regulator [Pyrinomonadaceae bacterium]
MSKRKLLLADDSVTIQKVVNLTFADEGIEVISVGDGDAAWEKFVELSPDLVMADVNMPGLTGYQLCEKIRGEQANHQTPVILLVGSFEPFDEEEARRVRADDYLTKPFQSIRQLVNKVTVLLNSSGETAELPAVKPEVSTFADTLEMEKAEVESTSSVQYSDAGYDDEMIETSSVSNYAFDESQKFESKPAGESEIDYSAYGATQPLSSEDIKEFDLINPVSSNVEETAEELTDTVSEESAQTYEIIADEEAAETEAPTEEVSENENLAEESVTEIESESREETETESESEEPVAETETAVTEEPVEEPVAEETSEPEREEEIPMPEVASVLQLDEANPLELPPIESDLENSEVELETEDEIPVVVPPPVSSETSAAVSQNMQFSPELIDEIVQKVVEKLSEKAVTDIAWEVVPEVTERIVKKMAEEKLKD